MQIEIIKTIYEKVVVNIEFPYYFFYDSSSESYCVQTYGKIEENDYIIIKLTHNYDDRETSINIEYGATGQSVYSYINDEYKCSRECYENGRRKYFEFLSEANL